VSRIKENKNYLNFIDENYFTALDYAFLKNNLFVVSCLIREGAYILNINNISQNNILSIIIDNRLDILKFLYYKDIRIIELKNDYGQTPLFIAVRLGNTNIIEWLVDNGANIKHLTNVNNNILNMNRQYNNNRSEIYEKIQSILLKPVYKVIKNHDLKLLEETLPFFIENGINKNLMNDKNEFVLDVALKSCNYRSIESIEVVDYLIAKGFHKFHKENITTSVVTGIIMNEKMESLKFFIQHGLDLEMENRINWTPLFTAVLFNSIKIVELLIENKSNINHRCRKGRTPLFNAIKYHQSEMVKLLLEKGANTDYVDNEKQNVYDFNEKYNKEHYSSEYEKIKTLLEIEEEKRERRNCLFIQ